MTDKATAEQVRLLDRLKWLQKHFEEAEQSNRFFARQELQERLPDIIAALQSAAPRPVSGRIDAGCYIDANGVHTYAPPKDTTRQWQYVDGPQDEHDWGCF